jgi:predicted porin
LYLANIKIREKNNMKKSLIAVALLSIVGSANAAEVYALDGLTLDIGGEAEVQLLKSQTEDSDLAVETVNGSLSADASYEIAEEFVTGGYFELDGTSSDTTEMGDLYVYFTLNQSLTISYGNQSSILDDAGIGDDYAFGYTSFVVGAPTSGDQVIKYKYDNDNVFYAGLAFILNKEEVSGDYGIDANIGARVGDAQYTLFVAQSETSELKENDYILEGRYVYGNMAYAATYAYANAEVASADDTEINSFGLSASWDDGGRWSYAAGWANIDNSSVADAINDLYVNATFWITDEVTAYAEVGFTDEDSTDTGYAIGMDVNF